MCYVTHVTWGGWGWGAKNLGVVHIRQLFKKESSFDLDFVHTGGGLTKSKMFGTLFLKPKYGVN